MNDCRDAFVLLMVTGLAAAATVYLFIHPSNGAFATWAAALSTLVGAYHWLAIHDDKSPDLRDK